jgi:hypothetical protein
MPVVTLRPRTCCVTTTHVPAAAPGTASHPTAVFSTAGTSAARRAGIAAGSGAPPAGVELVPTCERDAACPISTG